MLSLQLGFLSSQRGRDISIKVDPMRLPRHLQHCPAKLSLFLIVLIAVLVLAIGCIAQDMQNASTIVPSERTETKPTVTPNLPPGQPQTGQHDRVWSIQCDEDWLVDYIIDLSEERESTTSDIIMWFEPGTIKEVGRTTTLVRCRALAVMLSTPDTYITYSYEHREAGPTIDYRVGN